MLKKLPVLLLLLITVTGFSQQQDTTSVSWYLSPAFTLLNGDHHVSQSVSLSTGVRMKSLQIGLGAAIDYYKIRSLPLYLDLKYKWRGKPAPFLFAQGGYNVAWALEHQHSTEKSSTGTTVYNNGSYFNAGAGAYVFRDGKEAVSVSLGYSVKKLTELYQVTSWAGGVWYYNNAKMDYTLRRISLTLAYEF